MSPQDHLIQRQAAKSLSNESKNATLIIVTHDMDVAKLADRVVEVLDGEIISAGEESLINSKIDV